MQACSRAQGEGIPLKTLRDPRLVVPTVLAAATIAVLLASGCTVWRIGQAAELARQSEPLQHAPEGATMRLLIVGDSTAVGTGASSGGSSVAGLIAHAYPLLAIENRARDGATFANVADQLGGGGRFDLVLVQAGGNDVIRLRGFKALGADIERVTALARERADLVVLMPAGNVGNAPFFFAPVSWLMTWRSRRLHALVQAAAAQQKAVYVNLFHERESDPFVAQPGLNARDGLHPSDAGYRVWYSELLAQAELASHLAAARAR
jgi:lysophospholipase L1-like esterase